MRSKIKPAFRRSRWVAIVAVICTLVGLLFWKNYIRTFASGDGIEVAWSNTPDAEPGTVSFRVRDETGGAFPGLEVTSESHSGWAARVTTNSSGHAHLKPGEREVVAIWVGERRVPLRPDGQISKFFFLPVCYPAIRFEITVPRSEKN